MAGEVLLINPRRKRKNRRRPRKARAHRRRRLVATNPHRRRRSHRRINARHRRIRRNPRIPILGSVNLTGIAAGAGGYIGTRYGTGWVLSMLPPEWGAGANAPMVRIGVKALVGIVGLPMLAKALKLKGVAGPLALGGGIAVAVDIFETYLAKMIPIPMSDYEQGYITAYEPGQITGVDDMGADTEGAYSGGAY